ncbi:MAG: ribonuclease domain-containing protein [Rhodanobacteraceae bacterium]
MNTNRLLIAIVAVIAAIALWRLHDATTTAPGVAATQSSRSSAQPALPGFLPAEARDTLQRIADNGPFEHRQDGSVFNNREHRLPEKPRGYYHEYTVETPDIAYRGARRIITGGQPPAVYYYTDDHYRSFRRFEVPR